MSAERDTKKLIGNLFIIIATGVASLILVDKTTSILRPQIVQPPVLNVNTVEVKPSEFPDFDALATLKHLSVISNFETWTPNATIVDSKYKQTVIVQKGTVSKVYVLVKASLNGKPLTQWESIYVKMNNLGGHIFRKDSLSVPSGYDTTVLYAANAVSYLPTLPYSEALIPAMANWFKFFKEGSTINIVAFISSLRPAKIDDLSLYYECAGGVDSCEISIKK